MGITIMLGYTANKRSFAITREARTVLLESREKLEKATNSRQRINGLTKELAYLDEVIGKQAANPDIVQQEIINTFTKVGGQIELVKLEEVHTAQDAYFKVYSNRLVLSGDYESLIRATYAYEKDFEYSRVVSCHFYVVKDPRTQRKKLYEQIIFQNYEKIH
ncbi:hypothetical protein [Aquimarina hainanensis]|uniref:hypothetical protein n=1 Tax=Aquimarina hainanensis TaxID=1578017 RepID=UPI00361122E8